MNSESEVQNILNSSLSWGKSSEAYPRYKLYAFQTATVLPNITFPLSCVSNSAMFPFMFYKLFNANSTVFLFFFRSSRPEVFCKKGVLRNFAKFIVKHLCHSLFFDKVAGRRPATLWKKRLWQRCFLTEHLFLQNTSDGCSCFFQCLFVTSHTLHFTLFTSTSTFFRSYFSVFNFVVFNFFTKKRKEKKKIFIENQKKIWEIVVLTDRCIIKKIISKKNVM